MQPPKSQSLWTWRTRSRRKKLEVMGAPLLRGLELFLLPSWCHPLLRSQCYLLLQPHQYHLWGQHLPRLPFQWLLLLLLPPSSCRLNHRPPPPLRHPFLSLFLQNLRIPKTQVQGYWVNPLPKRSVYVHDKPTRIKWLTFAQLSDTIHQMPTHYITQGSPRSMLLGVQEHLVMGPPCMIAPTPIFAALPLM